MIWQRRIGLLPIQVRSWRRHELEHAAQPGLCCSLRMGQLPSRIPPHRRRERWLWLLQLLIFLPDTCPAVLESDHNLPSSRTRQCSCREKPELPYSPFLWVVGAAFSLNWQRPGVLHQLPRPVIYQTRTSLGVRPSTPQSFENVGEISAGRGCGFPHDVR